MKTKIILFILCSLFMLSSCESAKTALQGQTRAERNDEFLVEKKNPLSMPPDYEKLPKPIDDTFQNTISNESKEIKAKLKIKKEKNLTNLNTDNNSLEKKIIEKISN